MYAARVATLVVVVGGWQLFTKLKIVDPFFYGQPSGIVLKFRDWVEHGTAFGSIWAQIWVTMKEALLGFVFGVTGGVILGVLLGQVRFLADVLGPYIKALNALPRIVLGSIFIVALGLGRTGGQHCRPRAPPAALDVRRPGGHARGCHRRLAAIHQAENR